MPQKRFFLAVLFISIVLPLSKQLFAQEEGEIIILSERVGEVIDLEENNKYNLFPAFKKLQSAVFLKFPNGSYILKITYLDEITGEDKVEQIPRTEWNIQQYKNKIDGFNGSKPFVASNSLIVPGVHWYITLYNSETITSITLLWLVGDSLAIFDLGETSWIPVDSIVTIRRVRKSDFLTGAGIGFIAGAVTGASIGLSQYEPGGWFDFGPGYYALGCCCLGTPVGFFLGGIISVFSRKDETYNLSQKKHEQKLKIIRFLLSKY